MILRSDFLDQCNTYILSVKLTSPITQAINLWDFMFENISKFIWKPLTKTIFIILERKTIITVI